MQNIVSGWCNFLGVTDQVAISVATGAVAAGLLFIVTIVVLAVAFFAALVMSHL